MTTLDDLYNSALAEHRNEKKRAHAFIAACGAYRAPEVAEADESSILSEVGGISPRAAIDTLSQKIPGIFIDEMTRRHVVAALRQGYPCLSEQGIYKLMRDFSADRVMDLVEERNGQTSTWAFMDKGNP